MNWLVVSNIFDFHPYLGKWSNLTNIFEMGWNHQLVKLFELVYIDVYLLQPLCLLGLAKRVPKNESVGKQLYIVYSSWMKGTLFNPENSG